MDQAPLSLAFVRRLALVLVFSIMGCAQEKGVHLIANISAVSPLDPEDARGILTRFRDERSEFYDYLERLPARDAVILEYGSDGGYEACAILKTSSRKYRVVTSTAQLFGRPVQEWRRFVMAFDDDSGWAASSLECLRKSLAKDIAALIKKAPRRDTDHVEWMLVSLFSGESSCAMLVESQSLLWPLDPELGNSSSAEARSLASRLSEMMEIPQNLFRASGSDSPTTRAQRKNSTVVPSLDAIAETVDAIHTELALSGLCKGGESIEVAMRAKPDEERTIEMVYRVPGILQVYRLGYVQSDGVVILTDDLSFRDWETRYSMKPVDSARFSRMYREFAVRLEATVAAATSPGEHARHEVRVAHKREASQQP